MIEPRPRGTCGQPPGGAIAHPRFKGLVFLTLCALPGGGSAMLWLRGISIMPLAAYGIVSLLALFLYWHDKRKARVDSWRTPENVLHVVELAGGWPGALLAQQLFRHKTRKLSYQRVFWAIVLLHQVFWVDQLFLGATLFSLF